MAIVNARRYISESIHLSQSLKLHQELQSIFSLFPGTQMKNPEKLLHTKQEGNALAMGSHMSVQQ